MSDVGSCGNGMPSAALLAAEVALLSAALGMLKQNMSTVSSRDLGFNLLRELMLAFTPDVWTQPPGQTPQQPANPSPGTGTTSPRLDDWVVSNPDQGKATIDLGQDYQITVDENNSEMKLVNKHTGEVSDIWGDPHFDFKNGGGDQHLQFHNGTTLHLENGTDIRIETTPWSADGKQTLSTQLTITQGDKAIVVNGLDQNSLGDLSITQRKNDIMRPMFLDLNHIDLYEGKAGEGWLDSSAKPITQAKIDDIEKPLPDFPGPIIINDPGPGPIVDDKPVDPIADHGVVMEQR